MSEAVAFLSGAFAAWAFTSAFWHLRMGRGFATLARMASAGHIPDPDEVAVALGLRPP